MAANYLHGVEVIEVTKGPVPVRTTKTAVLGLVGTAPIHTVGNTYQTLNELTIIQNDVEAALYFGEDDSAYTIPQALKAIQKQGMGLVLVVNVFDPAQHYTVVTDQSNTFNTVTNKLTLPHTGVSSVTLRPIPDVPPTLLPITNESHTFAGTPWAITLAHTIVSSVVVKSVITEPPAEIPVTDESHTFDGGTGKFLLGHLNVASVVVKHASGSPTYALTTDYTLNAATGEVTRVGGGSITSGQTVLVSYTYDDTVVTYSASTDYSLNATTGVITRLDSGNIAIGQTVKVDYSYADQADLFTDGADFTYDPITGIVTRLTYGDIPSGATVAVTYNYADPSKVDAADIIGEVNALTGLRTGMQAFKDGRAHFGFNPKLLVAPGYSSTDTVATSLVVLATDLKGMAFLDAPVGTTVQQAIEGRGTEGDINFNTSSERAVLCYPMVKGVGPDGNPRLEPYSAYLAGLTAAVDIREGFWVSPSNHEILGLVGLERPISADYVDGVTTDANLLNEVGITTVFNEYGSGLRAWGNRTAAWPQETNPKNFMTVRRTADVLHESLARTCAQYLDRPLSEALIDAIIETCNRYMRTLKQMGALVDGMCLWDPAKNPPTELALGHATFTLRFLPTPPMERLTFESWVDIDLFQTFKPSTVKG